MGRGGEFSRAVRSIVEKRSGGFCEARVLGECSGQGVEFHHRRPRGIGGTRRPGTEFPSTALHVCRNCHRWIERNRDKALDLGWLVPQHADPELVPVWRASGLGNGWLVLFDKEGGIERWVDHRNGGGDDA